MVMAGQPTSRLRVDRRPGRSATHFVLTRYSIATTGSSATLRADGRPFAFAGRIEFPIHSRSQAAQRQTRISRHGAHFVNGSVITIQINRTVPADIHLDTFETRILGKHHFLFERPVAIERPYVYRFFHNGKYWSLIQFSIFNQW